MRRARAMLPYASTALFVVATSLGALAFAVTDVRDLREAEQAREAVPTASPSARALPELSRTGRLAFWRGDGSGAADLFVANIDGTLRRQIAQTDASRRVSLTRWSSDGATVTYVEDGTSVVLVRLDGARTVLPMRADVRALGYRISDVRWSPGGTSVAVTAVRRDLRADVLAAKLTDRELVRATSLEDAFAGDWLDEERVLVSTGGGVVGVLQAGTLNAIRPLTGMAATSPILGDDGRVHFLSGFVTSIPRDVSVPVLTASGATVWSIDLAGQELRQETTVASDDVRLDAMYTKGRYFAHRGISSTQVIVGDTVIVPPIEAGNVERVITSSDDRSAVGFTASRMVRFDLRRDGTFAPPVVVLDQVAGGDAWYPRTQPALGAVPPTAAPIAARYAFALGGHLWTMGPEGIGSFLHVRGAQTLRRAPPLAWSPSGDRLLTIEPAGPGFAAASPSTPIGVVIERDGTTTKLEEARAATGLPSWSPDGDAFVIIVDRRGADAQSASADLVAKVLTPSGRRVGEPIPARDAVWTRAGILTLTDRAIERVADGARAVVTELTPLLDDPRGEFPSDRQSVTYSTLTAARDGAYASLRVVVSPRTGATRFALAVLRVRDGGVVTFLPGSNVQDTAWAPRGALFAYTVSGNSAEVRDVASGKVLLTQPGRFAGWSPDARWAYVARPAGLFAYPIAGGDAVRVSSIGVAVQATAP